MSYGQKTPTYYENLWGNPDNGKTNKWLAEQLGKDPATVSKWCTNACQPSLEMTMTIAKLLKVDLNDLVRFEAVPDPVIKESTGTNN